MLTLTRCHNVLDAGGLGPVYKHRPLIDTGSSEARVLINARDVYWKFYRCSFSEVKNYVVFHNRVAFVM